MNRVCCLQFARLASRRIPEKFLQKIGDEALIDRGCRYMAEVSRRTGIVPILAVHTADSPLIAAAKRAGVRVLPLDDRAKTARIWPELIQPYTESLAEEFDVVWDANVCLRPFLKVETGEFLARQCLATARPWVAVVRRRGIIWSEFSPVPVIGDGELADTAQNPSYFEPSHLAYVWPSQYLRMPERELADMVTPLEVRLDWRERIDIDTPEDLELARFVAQGILGEAQDATRRR